MLHTAVQWGERKDKETSTKEKKKRKQIELAGGMHRKWSLVNGEWIAGGQEERP